jgi:hypothetical protein
MKSNFKDDNEELKHRNKQSALPAIQHPNYILQERVIGNLKKMMANDKNRVVEHKDLIKAFMEMFYRGNDNKNNYSKMQEDFITITNCALHLAYQSIEASYPVTSKSTICNTLFEEYRSYKDKGSWRKRMERLKESFHEVKILRDTAVTGELLGKAYQRIANESMMMGMQCARELEQVIEPNQKLINQKEIKGYQSL